MLDCSTWRKFGLTNTLELDSWPNKGIPCGIGEMARLEYYLCIAWAHNFWTSLISNNMATKINWPCQHWCVFINHDVDAPCKNRLFDSPPWQRRLKCKIRKSINSEIKFLINSIFNQGLLSINGNFFNNTCSLKFNVQHAMLWPDIHGPLDIYELANSRQCKSIRSKMLINTTNI